MGKEPLVFSLLHLKTVMEIEGLSVTSKISKLFSLFTLIDYERIYIPVIDAEAHTLRKNVINNGISSGVLVLACGEPIV